MSVYKHSFYLYIKLILLLFYVKIIKVIFALLSELVDEYDSKSYGEIHVGSSPTRGTTANNGLDEPIIELLWFGDLDCSYYLCAHCASFS